MTTFIICVALLALGATIASMIDLWRNQPPDV